MKPSDLELWVTIWPTFAHFRKIAYDPRVSLLRLNSAMITTDELPDDFQTARRIGGFAPLYFDIKGKQLRIVESINAGDHLELILNHEIEVETPTGVLFKAGADWAELIEVRDGKHLIFNGGPEYNVRDGESLHIRHPSLVVKGDLFTDVEIEKMRIAREFGYAKFFLSYVECQAEIDEFREHVGADSEIVAKIENMRGLEFVANEFKPQPGLSLMAARGDLYVEVPQPHHIADALKLIISKDPTASVGSRFLLSIIPKDLQLDAQIDVTELICFLLKHPDDFIRLRSLLACKSSDAPIHCEVPECCDFLELAWLYDIGYRRMMLCDSLCLHDEYLSAAVGAFDAFRSDYVK